MTGNTRIDLNGRMLVSTDNPGSPNLQANIAKLAVFTTTAGSAGLGRQFNRLDLSIKGDIERTVYQASSLTDGTTASNDDRDYNQYGETLRAAYALSSGVKPYVEVGADTPACTTLIPTSSAISAIPRVLPLSRVQRSS